MVFRLIGISIGDGLAEAEQVPARAADPTLAGDLCHALGTGSHCVRGARGGEVGRTKQEPGGADPGGDWGVGGRATATTTGNAQLQY